ncbi:sensor histidine kinase, partial [Actinomadura logoneensis]
AAAAPSAGTRGGPGDAVLWRRRLRHDIRHELGTVIMLASAVAVADDIGPASRERVEQLLGETRWLDHLLRQLDEEGEPDDGAGAPSGPAPAQRLRVDELAAEVVTGIRLATPHEVCFAGDAAWAHMDAVALWRALRNVLDNACRVAERRVNVRVGVEHGWVVLQVDDDGPGFGQAPGGLASLGLGIVHDLVSGYGGSLEIQTCEMGGARVRLLLPSAPPPASAAGPAGSGDARNTIDARDAVDTRNTVDTRSTVDALDPVDDWDDWRPVG